MHRICFMVLVKLVEKGFRAVLCKQKLCELHIASPREMPETLSTKYFTCVEIVCQR